MIEIQYSRLTPDCQWPEGAGTMRVRAIDVARAAALTLSAGAGRSRLRRASHATAVALEVLTHLRNGTGGRGLYAVDLQCLDATARAEVVHRLGVGLARVIGERSKLGLIDFFNLDALASDPNAPVRVVRRVAHSRRRPDFAGRNASGAWSLLEAKARTSGGDLATVRAGAVAQARAIELQRSDGTPISLSNRVACVARLSSKPITVFADDPPAEPARRVLAIDPALLTWMYYALARDVLASVRRPGPGLSGATSFSGVPLLEGQLLLGIHRALIPVLDSPDDLMTRRAELQEEFLGMQARADEAEDPGLSVGRDGLALAVRGSALDSILYGTE